jgi:hypothetical protein
MPIYNLQYAARVGSNYFSLFRLPNATTVVRSLTAGQYAALAERGAGGPPNTSGNPQAMWLQSWEEWAFDTPSEKFDPGYISDAWPGNITLNLAPLRELTIPAGRVTGDVTQPATLVFQLADLPPGVTITAGIAVVPD